MTPTANRILFVHNAPTTFVTIDRKLLQQQWQISEWYQRDRFINLAALVQAVCQSDLVFCWFAGWHSFMPVWLARLLDKPALVVVGGYDTANLSSTPRVYLIPVGADVMRAADADNFVTREFHVVDQKLPVPFPIVNSELEGNPNWIPTVDTIFDEMFQIRRHSDFRAYHDSGYLNESEMTFDSRLVGRSVWNTRWLLIIPGRSLLSDPEEGLERFINGPELIGGTGERTGNGISDIKLFFHTYAYSGN